MQSTAMDHEKFLNVDNFISNRYTCIFLTIFYYSLQSGMYWLQLVDKYAANWSVLLIAIAECILISWVYGANRFLRDIQDMIGQKSRIWTFFWTWMWKVITPAALLVCVCVKTLDTAITYIYIYIHTHTYIHTYIHIQVLNVFNLFITYFSPYRSLSGIGVLIKRCWKLLRHLQLISVL
jgi:hypothetical protein